MRWSQGDSAVGAVNRMPLAKTGQNLRFTGKGCSCKIGSAGRQRRRTERS
jgi:hypothetical protein